MTEAEWLGCGKPGDMIDHLNEWTHSKQKGHVAANQSLARKERLFCCAGCRLLWLSMPEDSARKAVEIAERFADGEATEEERRVAEAAAEQVRSRVAVESAAYAAAFWTVWSDVRGNHNSGAGYFYDVAADGLAYQVARARGRAWEKAKTAGLLRLSALLRDIFGNPFRPTAFSPAWRTDTALALARRMYDSSDFSAMPILADALQDAGCDNTDVLDHCRNPGEHVRGCWVVDLVLGKE
jgi:hypothetical protein